MNMNMFTSIMFDYLYNFDDTRAHAADLAQIALDETDTESDAVALLSCWLEDEWRAQAPKLSGVYGQLFSTALDLIVFEQIAQRFIDEA